MGQGFTEVTGAAMGLVGAMNSLVNLTNIWSNDTLSAG
jgi:hypothetical protein